MTARNRSIKKLLPQPQPPKGLRQNNSLMNPTFAARLRDRQSLQPLRRSIRLGSAGLSGCYLGRNAFIDVCFQNTEDTFVILHRHT